MSLLKQLEASVAYYQERNRQTGIPRPYTLPLPTDEQLEAVHDQLQQVATEPDPVMPEGATWLPVMWREVT